VAQKIIDAHYGDSPNKPPVIAGAGLPIGTHREVWHTGSLSLFSLSLRTYLKSLLTSTCARIKGTEGIGVIPDAEIIAMRNAQEQRKKPSKAAEQFLVSKAKEFPGQLIVVGLGALTNVAKAIEMDPSFSKNVLVRQVTRTQTPAQRNCILTLSSFLLPNAAYGIHGHGSSSKDQSNRCISISPTRRRKHENWPTYATSNSHLPHTLCDI
jgi:hypothetical protein